MQIHKSIAQTHHSKDSIFAYQTHDLIYSHPDVFVVLGANHLHMSVDVLMRWKECQMGGWVHCNTN